MIVALLNAAAASVQPEYGEPPNAKDFLPPLTADRDSHIGDDLILQVSPAMLLGFCRVVSLPYPALKC